MLQVAFDNQPESFGHRRFLAMLLESQERDEEALEVVEEALRHRPDDRELYLQRIRLRLTLFGAGSLPPGTEFRAGTEWS